MLAAWVINRWCRELYGDPAECLGVALWCFDPTVLAFAQVVTPDIPAAVAGLLATYVFGHYLDRPSWQLAIASGLLLGVAQLKVHDAGPLRVLAPRRVGYLHGCCPMSKMLHAWITFRPSSSARATNSGDSEPGLSQTSPTGFLGTLSMSLRPTAGGT